MIVIPFDGKGKPGRVHVHLAFPSLHNWLYHSLMSRLKGQLVTVLLDHYFALLALVSVNRLIQLKSPLSITHRQSKIGNL